MVPESPGETGGWHDSVTLAAWRYLLSCLHYKLRFWPHAVQWEGGGVVVATVAPTRHLVVAGGGFYVQFFQTCERLAGCNGPTFSLCRGYKLKWLKGIQKTNYTPIKFSNQLKKQLYQSHSSAVNRLNIICCFNLTIHLWLRWKSPFIIVVADWCSSGHGGLFLLVCVKSD